MKSSNEHERRPWNSGESQPDGNDARSLNPRQGTGSRKRARASTTSQDVFREGRDVTLFARKRRARRRVHSPAPGSCLGARNAGTRTSAEVCPRSEAVCKLPLTVHHTNCKPTCNCTHTFIADPSWLNLRRGRSRYLDKLEHTFPEVRKGGNH